MEVTEEERNRLWERHYSTIVRNVRLFCKRTNNSQVYKDLIGNSLLRFPDVLKNYDPDKGALLASYLGRMVQGQCLQYVRDKSYLIHIPAYLQERCSKVDIPLPVEVVSDSIKSFHDYENESHSPTSHYTRIESLDIEDKSAISNIELITLVEGILGEADLLALGMKKRHLRQFLFLLADGVPLAIAARQLGKYNSRSIREALQKAVIKVYNERKEENEGQNRLHL